MLFLLAAALPSLMGSGPAPAGCVNVPAPKVDYRANVARATSSPWVNANASRFTRNPEAKFCIDAPGKSSALAAAEAFAYDVAAFLRTGQDGAGPFEQMIAFLRGLPAADLPERANIGIIDDGTPQTGELMNLLTRRNLLYRPVKAPDSHLDLNVSRGEEPDPGKQAYAIRRKLGDDKRLLRIYGSEVVIGRLTGDASRARVHLLNYGGRPVSGLRVRVLGKYSKAAIHAFGIPDAKLADVAIQPDAAEFTLESLNEYAVIDLTR
ncbi:MAG TPA: hypothetical protein VHB50_15700 [Bryobacteraceae bacterium]|nr:hypothetical protein [Bryobacteraceae bacterium]